MNNSINQNVVDCLPDPAQFPFQFQLPIFPRGGGGGGGGGGAFRFEDFMRAVDQRRVPVVTRGATQSTIERNTFPHKYKKVRSQIPIDNSYDT